MTVLFRVTEVGLKAATTAAEHGIKVVLTTFKVGSGFGYTPDGSETSLRGDVLYEDVITKYTDRADGSLLLTCTISVQAGPFDFGEVGIFTQDDVLFAVTSFEQLQTKYSSLGSNVNSTFTFNCQLRLGQSVAIFTPLNQSAATAAQSSSIKYVNTWADVLPPSQMLALNAKQLAVSEVDSKGDYSTLVQTDINGKQGWSLQTNFFSFGVSPTIKAVTDSPTTVSISSSDWQSLVAGPVATTTTYGSTFDYVIETENNLFRAGRLSLLGNGDILFTLAQAIPNDTTFSAGHKIRLWVNDSALLKTSLEQDLQAQIDLLIASITTLQEQVTLGIPSGLIAQCREATIPTGWILCDGTNGTPDLRDKFVVGAGSVYTLGAVGGSRDAVVVSHTHNATLSGSASSGGAHTHTYKTYPYGMGLSPQPSGQQGNANTNSDWGFVQTGNPSGTSEGAHTHSVSITGIIDSAGSSGTGKNMPPYYSLYYIYKV